MGAHRGRDPRRLRDHDQALVAGPRKLRTQEVTEPARFQLLAPAVIAAASDPPSVLALVENSKTHAQLFDARGLADLELHLDFPPYLDGSAAVTTPQGTFAEVDSFRGSRPTVRRGLPVHADVSGQRAGPGLQGHRHRRAHLPEAGFAASEVRDRVRANLAAYFRMNEPDGTRTRSSTSASTSRTPRATRSARSPGGHLFNIIRDTPGVRRWATRAST